MNTIKTYKIVKSDEGYKLKLVNTFDYNCEYLSLHDIADYANVVYELDEIANEKVIIAALDFNNTLLGFFEVGSGSEKKCDIDSRLVTIFLILTKADKFVLIHNHPNNINEPSENDKLINGGFYNIANVLNIEFYESIIIVKNGYNFILKEEAYDYGDMDEA